MAWLNADKEPRVTKPINNNIVVSDRETVRKALRRFIGFVQQAASFKIKFNIDFVLGILFDSSKSDHMPIHSKKTMQQL